MKTYEKQVGRVVALNDVIIDYEKPIVLHFYVLKILNVYTIDRPKIFL